MAIVSSTSDVGFSYFIPPGVPADRTKALQDAFNAMIKDTAFLADAKQGKLPIRPASARDVTDIVANVLTAPPDVVSRVVELMKFD
jgi:tripartite-type tricarboxylate transporter receptor subunit TctC